MRSSIVRQYKSSSALNGVDLNSIISAIGSVANTVGTVVSSNQPSATNNSAAWLNQLPSIIASMGGNQQQPVAAPKEDNTALYVGLGIGGLLLIGGMFMIAGNNSNKR